MIDQTQIEAWSNLLVSSLHSSGEFCGNGTVALVEFRAMFAPMRGGGCCASLSEETRARPMRAYRANKELPGATVQGIVPQIQWDDAWQMLLSQCKALLPNYQKMDHAGAYQAGDFAAANVLNAGLLGGV